MRNFIENLRHRECLNFMPEFRIVIKQPSLLSHRIRIKCNRECIFKKCLKFDLRQALANISSNLEQLGSTYIICLYERGFITFTVVTFATTMVYFNLLLLFICSGTVIPHKVHQFLFCSHHFYKLFGATVCSWGFPVLFLINMS